MLQQHMMMKINVLMAHSSSNAVKCKRQIGSILQLKKRTIIHNIVVESFGAELAIL
jgi:hypothetical protein